jgi:hypothetical protein
LEEEMHTIAPIDFQDAKLPKLETLIELNKEKGQLNNALEQTNDEETRNRTLEAREVFQSKYNNHFRREAEKTTMFRQMNLEKPTKWFSNLAVGKNCIIYSNWQMAIGARC